MFGEHGQAGVRNLGETALDRDRLGRAAGRLVDRQFAIAPELPPGWSVWTDESQPHGFGAVIDSIIDSLRSAISPGERDHLYRLWMYRDVTTPLTQWSTWCFVYIRNDLLPLFNQIRLGSP